MKGLNKIALATAVAAAPFATQAMEPMNDSQMGDVTGQAGVTIELETTVGIDTMSYTQDPADGSFLMNGISIGGITQEEFQVGIDIDLEDNGDALISFGPLDDTAPVDLNMGVDSFQLTNEDRSETSTLMSNFDMDMWLGQLDIRANNDDDNGNLDIDVDFVIDNLDIDADVAGVDIRGMRMAGEDSFADLTAVDENGDPESIASLAVSNPVSLSMNVGTGGAQRAEGGFTTADGSEYSGPVNADNVLAVTGIEMNADMLISNISIGGSVEDGANPADASIGSVGLEGLNVTADMAIYGRE